MAINPNPAAAVNPNQLAAAAAAAHAVNADLRGVRALPGGTHEDIGGNLISIAILAIAPGNTPNANPPNLRK